MKHICSARAWAASVALAMIGCVARTDQSSDSSKGNLPVVVIGQDDKGGKLGSAVRSLALAYDSSEASSIPRMHLALQRVALEEVQALKRKLEGCLREPLGSYLDDDLESRIAQRATISTVVRVYSLLSFVDEKGLFEELGRIAFQVRLKRGAFADGYFLALLEMNCQRRVKGREAPVAGIADMLLAAKGRKGIGWESVGDEEREWLIAQLEKLR